MASADGVRAWQAAVQVAIGVRALVSRSSNELSSQIALAVAYHVVPERDAFNLKGTVICTQRMIESLRDRIRERHAPPPPET